jgi:hypothetical protein
MFDPSTDPRTWPNQPGFWESLGIFVLYAYMLVAILGDTYYTGVGLAKGLKEMNPINRWLFPKLGQALTCFVEAAAITVVGGVFMAYSMPLAYGYWGLIAALEIWMVYRNRKILGLSL